MPAPSDDHPAAEHAPLTEEQHALAVEYTTRLDLLKGARDALEAKFAEALQGLPHIDRLAFRVKDAESFARKCLPVGKPAKYVEPLAEVEDQIAGRILVFFTHDIDVVDARLKQWFTGVVEAERRKPDDPTKFGYESEQYIIVIDEYLKGVGWNDFDMPTTFELQLKTLFMHAWAEPQHDIGYKSSGVTDEQKRLAAWVASSAWGADRAFDELWAKAES